MKRFGLYIAIFTAFVLVVSCKKNQLKKPTEVSVYMDINRDVNDDASLVFTSGFLILEEFEMEGTRQEGAPVKMKREYPTGYRVDFTNSMPVNDLILDIPQGNYTELEISFDTYKEDGMVNLYVMGVYTNGASLSYPVVYEFKDKEKWKIKSESDSNGDLIVLDKNKPADSFIELDPQYWFDTVSSSQWDAADLTLVEGVETILVNEDVNSTIYNIVTDRIDETSMATFVD